MMDGPRIGQSQRREPFFGRAFFAAPAAATLPVVLVLCFLVQLAYDTTKAHDQFLAEQVALSGQALQQGRWWTLVTHMFLHVGWVHLGMNLAVALSVSTPVALALGRGVAGFVKFWLLFFICGIIGGLAFVVSEPAEVLALGASGAISGLWGAMVRVPLQPGPLDKPWSRKALAMSVPFLLINVVLMAVLSNTTELPPVAWQAHLGGFIAGVILISFFAAPRTPAAPGPWGDRHG